MKTEKKTVDPVVGGSTVSETKKIMLSGNEDNKGKEKNFTQKTKQKKEVFYVEMATEGGKNRK